LNPRSLRARLLLGAAAAIFLALAAAWVAMTLLFERHIERRVEGELTRDALRLVADLSLDQQGRPAIGRVPMDARYERPASGLYWQISASGGEQKSRSLWDQSLPTSPSAANEEWTSRFASGPFDQRVFLVERVVRPDRSRPGVLVQLAQDEISIRTAGREFGRELAVFLVLLWAILCAAAWVQVHLGLRPLRAVRRELDALRTSPAARLSEKHPPEIEALTTAINALASAREKDLVAARRRAADLAHGLKTPLAALSAQSRRAREAGATDAADGLDRAIAAATAAVDAELARSRAATIRHSVSGAQTPPLAVIERVIGVVERTEFGADRVFEVHVPEAMLVPMAPEDLAELMGALIENAARFAHRRVRVTGSTEALVALAIEDDGPGLGPDRAEEALARGGRLDESGSGHGLGLSIARELVEATRGTIRIESASLGGLHISVQWPRAQSPLSR
jgi:signal transduction histidine kinase